MKTLLVSILAIGLSTSAFAQTAATTPGIDADGNGSLSLAEAQAAVPGLTPEQFAAADKDASGGLSAEEYTALMSGGAATVPAGPAAPTAPAP